MARKSTKFIVIHCSQTRPSQNIGAKEIDRWHREKGWLKIGYNKVIKRDGTVEQGREDDAIQAHVRESATHLANHMLDAPVLIMACISHDGSPSTMARGSSIYPAIQNMLLAARGLGLGSVITTLHKRFEQEIKDVLAYLRLIEFEDDFSRF